MIVDDEKLKMIFKTNSEQLLCDIRENAYLKEFKKNETLISEMDDCNCIYILLSGNVYLYKIDSNFRRKIIFILKEFEWINEEYIANEKNVVFCEAMNDVTTLCISKDILLKLMKDNNDLCSTLFRNMACKSSRLYRQLKNASTTVSIDKKLSSKLWKLSQDYGKVTTNGIEIQLNLSTTFLADMIGTKRETISRELKQLSIKGYIIVENKKITVKSQEKLAEFYKEIY